MNARKLIALAALVTMIGWATPFLTSEAVAQWSDGGPEMYPLTYPPKESVVERDSTVAVTPVDTVQAVDALAQWSDGGPEMYPLTYPAETVAMQVDSRTVARECDQDRPFEVSALWSDGGPEMFPLTYPAKTATTDGETCLVKALNGVETGPRIN